MSSPLSSIDYFQLFPTQSSGKALPLFSLDPKATQKLEDSPPWPPVVSTPGKALGATATPQPLEETQDKSRRREFSDEESNRSVNTPRGGATRSAPKAPIYVMVDVKSQNCVSDSLYQELVRVTDNHILAGLDLDMAHIRYSELKEQMKVIEWELKKLERQWPALIESHVASDAHLKETCGRVVEEGGSRGFALINGVQRHRYTSFVGLPQYIPVKMRLQRMGYAI
ncbi:hypothetical protein WG66_016019 [Moniliophthora roreri]|uniref:Uncharacterized protein n=1 Tax=Moniliophthora roreri TaxID=221103 RepID=A0A0W0GB79_MONRR|nr:hypothetical protein WG66_016019 [Moniliophthora roreri]